MFQTLQIIQSGKPDPVADDAIFSLFAIHDARHLRAPVFAILHLEGIDQT